MKLTLKETKFLFSITISHRFKCVFLGRKDQLDVIHQGFYRVVHGTNSWGTAHSLKDVKPSISGKTGTAQTFYYDEDNPGNPKAPEVINATFVGYAPSKDPKLAVAVVFPRT